VKNGWKKVERQDAKKEDEYERRGAEAAEKELGADQRRVRHHLTCF
jgi:hypothetical protein